MCSLILRTPFFLPSQFEEKFEEMNGAEPPVNIPLGSSSGSNENLESEQPLPLEGSIRKEIEPRGQVTNKMSSDLAPSQEFIGGLMKIIPTEVDVSFTIRGSSFSSSLLFFTVSVSFKISLFFSNIFFDGFVFSLYF